MKRPRWLNIAMAVVLAVLVVLLLLAVLGWDDITRLTALTGN